MTGPVVAILASLAAGLTAVVALIVGDRRACRFANQTDQETTDA